MTLLSNINAPAAAPGGLTWSKDTDVVDVPDDLATELLGIVDGGFVEAPAKAKATKAEVTEPAPKASADRAVTETPAPKSRR